MTYKAVTSAIKKNQLLFIILSVFSLTIHFTHGLQIGKSDSLDSLKATAKYTFLPYVMKPFKTINVKLKKAEDNGKTIEKKIYYNNLIGIIGKKTGLLIISGKKLISEKNKKKTTYSLPFDQAEYNNDDDKALTYKIVKFKRVHSVKKHVVYLVTFDREIDNPAILQINESNNELFSQLDRQAVQIQGQNQPVYIEKIVPRKHFIVSTADIYKNTYTKIPNENHDLHAGYVQLGLGALTAQYFQTFNMSNHPRYSSQHTNRNLLCKHFSFARGVDEYHAADKRDVVHPGIEDVGSLIISARNGKYELIGLVFRPTNKQNQEDYVNALRISSIAEKLKKHNVPVVFESHANKNILWQSICKENQITYPQTVKQFKDYYCIKDWKTGATIETHGIKIHFSKADTHKLAQTPLYLKKISLPNGFSFDIPSRIIDFPKKKKKKSIRAFQLNIRTKLRCGTVINVNLNQNELGHITINLPFSQFNFEGNNVFKNTQYYLDSKNQKQIKHFISIIKNKIAYCHRNEQAKYYTALPNGLAFTHSYLGYQLIASEEITRQVPIFKNILSKTIAKPRDFFIGDTKYELLPNKICNISFKNGSKVKYDKNNKFAVFAPNKYKFIIDTNTGSNKEFYCNGVTYSKHENPQVQLKSSNTPKEIQNKIVVPLPFGPITNIHPNGKVSCYYKNHFMLVKEEGKQLCLLINNIKYIPESDTTQFPNGVNYSHLFNKWDNSGANIMERNQVTKHHSSSFVFTIFENGKIVMNRNNEELVYDENRSIRYFIPQIKYLALQSPNSELHIVYPNGLEYKDCIWTYNPAKKQLINSRWTITHYMGPLKGIVEVMQPHGYLERTHPNGKKELLNLKTLQLEEAPRLIITAIEPKKRKATEKNTENSNQQNAKKSKKCHDNQKKTDN